MIRITESLDIALIEKLRVRIAGRGLDERDSLSYHQVLYVEDVPAGTARMHRAGSAVVVEDIAVAPELGPAYREMLARSMVSKAVDSGAETVVVRDEKNDFYTELGFCEGERGVFAAPAAGIVFPCKCLAQEERK